MEITQYKQYCRDIVYHIQTKLGTHLPDDLLHDIFSNVREAVIAENAHAMERADYWEKSYKKLASRRLELQRNELRLKVARETKPIPPEVILQWMFMLEEGKYIRDKRVIVEDIGEEL